MSKVYSLWVDKMIQSRGEAGDLMKKLSYSKRRKEQKDPLMDYLMQFKDRMGEASGLLTKPENTAFFFVTLPEALPIAVITRFINWFLDFGIPVGGVIVNGLIEKETIGADTPEFVRNRVMMQEEHMGKIWEVFGENVRSIIPLFETEVQGPAMLKKTAKYLFA